jgi:hypothetical protein
MYNSDSNMSSHSDDEDTYNYSPSSHSPYGGAPRHERWIDPEDEIQRAMAASLAEYETQPIQSLTVECIPASLMPADSTLVENPEESHDGLYLPSSMARQVFGSTDASSHSLIVYKVTPLITIPSEDPHEEPIDLPMDTDAPIWCVLRGVSPDSATYLNDDAVRQMGEFPVKCRLTPITTGIPMGTKVTIRPLDHRFIELKDQETFMGRSIGRLHKVLWPGQILSVYSCELGDIIRLMVQDVTADSVPEPPPDMLVQVTDCDLEIDFDIPAEWFKKPDTPPVTEPEPEPAMPEPVAKLTRAELRAQRLAYFNKQNT